VALHPNRAQRRARIGRIMPCPSHPECCSLATYLPDSPRPTSPLFIPAGFPARTSAKVHVWTPRLEVLIVIS
jgi:hypothetical protein